MAGADYADMLYARRNGLDGLVEASKGMVAKAGARINVFLFSHDGSPAKEFKEWVPAGRNLRAAKRGDKQVLTVDGPGGAPLRVAAASDPQAPTIYYALSDCPARPFKSRFVSLVCRHVPTLSRTVITSDEMARVVDGVAGSGFHIKVRYAATTTPRGGGDLDTHAGYMDVPYKKFFGSLKAEQSVKTARLECTPAGPAGGEGAPRPSMLTMTRDCCFSASRSAGVLFDEALPRVASIAGSRIERLRSSANSADSETPEPLVINFGREIFTDHARSKGHVKALASMPRSTVGVYYCNTYIHASLVDYFDGSSYDILALVNDRLAIVPQIFATESSMGRLVNHIFERIGEGRVERYEKKAARR